MGRAERLKGNTVSPVQQISYAMERMAQPALQCMIVGKVWRSRQNGMVYDPRGISPTICVGRHVGVEPKIIVYEEG